MAWGGIPGFSTENVVGLLLSPLVLTQKKYLRILLWHIRSILTISD
jgi:hypothetical protein